MTIEAPSKTWQCLHDARAVCAACSDQDPRWREWRGGGEPPNARRVEPVRVVEPWADYEDELLFIRGFSAAEVADMLGRSVMAVYARRARIRSGGR